MPILGVDGPIEVTDVSIAPFECLSFDWSSQAAPSASLDRLTLKNRAAVVANPFSFHEALTIPIDEAVSEVDNSSFDIVCSFSAPSKVKEIQKRLKTGKKLVAAAELTSEKLKTSVTEQVEWLKCAIRIGLEGSYCGILGVCKGPGIDAYAAAQAATGAPLVLLVPDDQVLSSIDSLKACGATLAKVAFLNIRDELILQRLMKEECRIGYTCPTFDIRTHATPFNAVSPVELSALSSLIPKEKLLLSPGLCMRHHFSNFGGLGLNRPEMRTDAIDFFSFPWEPPRVEVKIEKQLWSCDVCGTSGDESVRNYTKMGFTYCSMTCLSTHRKAGFKYNVFSYNSKVVMLAMMQLSER